MKTVLLFVSLLLITASGRAQVQVLLLRDTASHPINQATLDKQYTPLMTLFQAQPKGGFDAIQAHQKQFATYLAKRRDTPQKGIGLITHQYYSASGKAAYVLVQTDRPQPDSALAKLVTVLREFYETATFPAAGSAPFRLTSFLESGRTVSQPRTVRRGAGILSSLEAAQKTTRPDTVRMLAFNQLELATVPEVVYRFPKLEELDLSKNSLHELPARLTTIATLQRLSLMHNLIPDDSVFVTPNTHLKSLNLQGNKLTRVPPAVRLNRRLASLWLGNNALRELDTKTLRRLRRLNDLNLYNVGLTTLPKGIKRLKSLQTLDLYYNKLTTLPAQLGKLKRLEQLAVAHNNLSALPQTLPKLQRLQALYVHHNRISQLPTRLGRLTQLRVLDLGYNWFTVPPTQLTSLKALEDLDMSNNNLQELPASLAGMKHLKHLYLRSNPFTQKNVKAGPYAGVIQQLEANKTEVFY
jgi:Leucine-rich repeat (LRR) protein